MGSARNPVGELLRGARAFLDGASFVARTPGVWTWVLTPAAVAVAIGLGLTALGLWGVMLLSQTVAGGDGFALEVARTLFDVLGGLVVLGAAGITSVAVAQPLARLSLGKLATRLEESFPPSVALAPRGASSDLWTSIRVALAALGVSLPAIGALEVLTLFAPEAALVTEPLAFVVSGLALAWELFDHPFSRRGLGVGERLRWMRGRFFAVLGFAITAQIVMLIPGVDLFLLPIGVLGATRLFAEGEGAEEAATPRLPQ